MNSKQRHLLQILRILALLAVIIATWWYVSANWDDFTSVSITQPWWIVVASVCIIFSIYSVGMLMELAIEPHGPKLKKAELFGLSSINRFSNYISPGYLGLVVRSMYLKKRYGLSVAKFSSSFLVSSLMQFLLSGFIVLGLFLTLTNNSRGANVSAIFLVVAATITFAVVLSMPLARIGRYLSDKAERRSSKILERLAVAVEGFTTVRSYPWLLPRTGFWAALTIFTSALTIYALFQAIGADVSLTEATFIAALSGWSILFSITPGNIGVREGLMAFAAKVAGVGVPDTLIVAVLLRLISFIIVGLFALYFTPKLLGSSFLALRQSVGQESQASGEATTPEKS